MGSKSRRGVRKGPRHDERGCEFCHWSPVCGFGSPQTSRAFELRNQPFLKRFRASLAPLTRAEVKAGRQGILISARAFSGASRWVEMGEATSRGAIAVRKGAPRDTFADNVIRVRLKADCQGDAFLVFREHLANSFVEWPQAFLKHSKRR